MKIDKNKQGLWFFILYSLFVIYILIKLKYWI